MKKKLSVLAMAIIIALAFSFSGCNLIKSGTMKKIKGTYELTGYSLTWEAGRQPEGEDTVENYLERDEIKMYLVIDGSSIGHIVYQSKNVERVYYKVALSYTYDAEETDEIQYVNYKSGSAYDDEKELMHQEQLAVFAGSDITLSYTLPNYRLIVEESWLPQKVSTRYVGFKKVSKKTDMSYVKDQLGSIPAETDMALEQFDGVLSSNSTLKYIYYYIDFDYRTKKADVYYALVPTLAEGQIPTADDIVDVVLRGQDITRQGGDIVNVGEVTIGERTYTSGYSGNLTDKESGESFFRHGGDNIAESIANSKEFYLMSNSGENA